VTRIAGHCGPNHQTTSYLVECTWTCRTSIMWVVIVTLYWSTPAAQDVWGKQMLYAIACCALHYADDLELELWGGCGGCHAEKMHVSLSDDFLLVSARRMRKRSSSIGCRKAVAIARLTGVLLACRVEVLTLAGRLGSRWCLPDGRHWYTHRTSIPPRGGELGKHSHELALLRFGLVRNGERSHTL